MVKENDQETKAKWQRAPLFFLALCFFLIAMPARGQQVHRNGFEGRDTAWVKATADTAFRENKHVTTDQFAHDGLRSEMIQLTAEQGSFIYYQYTIGRALLNDELAASVWVKANRPGVQLAARLVLPHERNPNNLDDHLTVTIRGDRLKAAGHWERLELRRPCDLIKQQQGVMQATLKRPVNIQDAYIDQLLLNVYTGPGLTEVWIDDLEVGPVIDPTAPLQSAGQRPGPPGPRVATPASRTKTGRAVAVEHNQGQLFVGSKRFFVRGIRHSDTPLKTLRDAGFNTIWVDYAASPELLQEAVDLGFWLVPALPVSVEDKRMVSADVLSKDIRRFLTGDAVLFWDQGGALTFEQVATVSQATQMIKTADPGRPVGGDVWDGLLPYSRTLDLVGAHRWPLMTTLELPKYRDWLNQRRLLANPGTYMWTWVQTHLPDWYLAQVYGRSDAAGIGEPIGPQPEQIRLLTYTALAAGCRGLGFWSDRFLADSHQGRDRLHALALINQELEMLEPLLTTVDDPPVWIDTSVADIKAAVLRSPRGVLVLPIWMGKGAQMVPGQAAVSQLSMVVPQVPQGTQAWEVTPGHVHGHLKPRRVPGGWKITIPEFGLTTAVVFTSDISLVIRFQEQARSKCRLAAQWTRDLAALELAKALRIEQQLEQAGHTLPDGRKLIDNAQNRLSLCEESWNSHLYTEAYLEAQRALRPIRILMRAQWDEAMKGLDTPVATPFGGSFYTLPRHWAMLKAVATLKPAANVLPDGGFEVDPARTMTGWVLQDPTLDEVQMGAARVTEVVIENPAPKTAPAKETSPKTLPAKTAPVATPTGKGPKTPATPTSAKTAPTPPKAAAPPVTREPPKEGRQCLLLEIRPKDPLNPPLALQRTYLGIHSPAVKLPPGSLVQISAWVRIPKAIGASDDGALIYDSAGGEPLAIRLTEPTPWKKYTIYRTVPASGQVHVTLALTGIGKAYFDDVRIEPLVGAPGSAPVGAVAARR
jgi:hypothetical protein